MSNIKVCRLLDSNHGPLASEATALPTEPQPLPYTRSSCHLGCRQETDQNLLPLQIEKIAEPLTVFWRSLLPQCPIMA